MHTSVTSDEVKYTPHVSCARHIDAYGHLAQKVQLKFNIFKVFVYELKRKYVYRFVRNCCSVLVFGVRNNSGRGGGVRAFATTSCCAAEGSATKVVGGGQENLLLRATYFVRLLLAVSYTHLTLPTIYSV